MPSRQSQHHDQSETPEGRLLALIRLVKYGTLQVKVHDGVPVKLSGAIELHLTKPFIPSQLALVAGAQETTTE